MSVSRSRIELASPPTSVAAHRFIRKRAMTSINYILPPEILLEVFYHATATHGALGLQGVLLTCRLWCTLALNESRLWTCISFDTIFASLFHRLSPAAAKRFAWQCVNRSGRLQMHFIINMDAYHTLEIPHGLTEYTHARTIMAKVNIMMDIEHFKGPSSRLETLVIHQHDGSRKVWPGVFCYMLRAWRIPLRRLELQNYSLSVARCWTKHIPSLTSIVLIDPSWMYSRDMKVQRDSAVTQLTFDRCAAWSLDDLLVLRVYQALTILRLLSKPRCREQSDFEHGLHAHDDLPVLLPSVHTLSLTGKVPHRVLGALNLPALETIEIRNHGSRHSMRHLRNTTLHHNVTKLEVRIAGRGAHWWTRDLAAVLTATLNLRTFVVSRPMLSHLPHTSVPDTANLVVCED